MQTKLKTWYMRKNLDERRRTIETMSVRFRAALARLIPYPSTYFDTGRSKPMVHLRCAVAHVLHSHYQLSYPAIAAITGRTGHASIYDSDNRWQALLDNGTTIVMPPGATCTTAKELEQTIIAALDAEGFGK